jgi:hypothetical protein
MEVKSIALSLGERVRLENERVRQAQAAEERYQIGMRRR